MNYSLLKFFELEICLIMSWNRKRVNKSKMKSKPAKEVVHKLVIKSEIATSISKSIDDSKMILNEIKKDFLDLKNDLAIRSSRMTQLENNLALDSRNNGRGHNSNLSTHCLQSVPSTRKASALFNLIYSRYDKSFNEFDYFLVIKI